MAGRVGYAQLSNGLWLNDKACDLMDRNPRAFAMWVMSLSYASDNLTDGVLTARALHRLGCDDDTRDVLLESGMWEPCDDGVRIHDYLQHNTSREQIESNRARDVERKRSVRANSVRPDVQTDSARTSGRNPDGIPSDLNQNQNQNQNQNGINNPCCCSSTESTHRAREWNNNNDDEVPTQTPIPPDWTPDGEDAAYAIRYRLDPDRTGRAFRDYHLRHGTMSADWHAMFRGWCQRNPDGKPPPDER